MKILALLFLLAGFVFAQGPGPDMTIDAAVRADVINGALKALDDNYVYPDIAKKMNDAIRDHQHRNDYDSFSSAQKFAEKLTDDLRDVSHDKHLRIIYSSNPIPPERANRELTKEEFEQQKSFAARTNFGFEKLERLAGNIGYLDLRAFMPAGFVGDTAAAAMNFLSNTEGLIIDLRNNGGGDPATVALLASYLFGPEVVHLNDLYWRPRNETQQWWTLPYVPGKRLAGKDVYVLTSQRTFSAAEEFTYDLKNLKRATVVGEVTGGGAHPGGPHRLNDHFAIGVPSGRAINPYSKTDWEGTGVEPDVKVPADKALTTAHLMALEKQLPTLTNPGLKNAVSGAIDRLKKELTEQK